MCSMLLCSFLHILSTVWILPKPHYTLGLNLCSWGLYLLISVGGYRGKCIECTEITALGLGGINLCSQG